MTCTQNRHLGTVAAFDGVVQVALVAFPVGADDARDLLVAQTLDALHGLEVELDPETIVPVVDEAERVGAVSVHVTVAPGHPAVGHQNRDLVQALRRPGPEVPHRGGVAQVGPGVPLLGVDEVRKLVGVAHEEHRGVVADQIPVALLGVDLEGESAHIALGVRGAALAGHGREAQEAFALRSRLQGLRLRVAADIAGDAQRAVGAGTLGVDHALRNAFPVEVGVLLEELPVLDQQRTARAGGQAVLIVADRDAGGGGEGGSVCVGHGILLVVRFLDVGVACALLAVVDSGPERSDTAWTHVPRGWFDL